MTTQNTTENDMINIENDYYRINELILANHDEIVTMATAGDILSILETIGLEFDIDRDDNLLEVLENIEHTLQVLYDFDIDTDDIESFNAIRTGEDIALDDSIRIIATDCIDGIMIDELGNDMYILGCASDWFIADILNIDTDVIQSMQEAEAFEAIGKLVVSMDKLEEYQQELVRYNGYGIHFSSYDHNEHNVTLMGNDYYLFKI